ncbi:hypothetical protein IFM89_011984 [Coptis chinensis]|uniref:Uncharacterized protein n=1 Tax=Coptis chinensis TaxID=261450 RepID=A0A835I973_9MAGN|nr:hypothetical protein IFM89_011984 [Coptis chinensis]
MFILVCINDKGGKSALVGFIPSRKVGAMNAPVRVSAILTNVLFMLNLDCDHYINNNKAAREAVCFLMIHRLEERSVTSSSLKGLTTLTGAIDMPIETPSSLIQALYGYNPLKGPKRPNMVSCDSCPCFGLLNKYSNQNGVGSNLEGSSGVLTLPMQTYEIKFLHCRFPARIEEEEGGLLEV